MGSILPNLQPPILDQTSFERKPYSLLPEPHSLTLTLPARILQEGVLDCIVRGLHCHKVRGVHERSRNMQS